MNVAEGLTRALESFYPGDAVLLVAANVLLQSSTVVLAAWVLSRVIRPVRRGAAARHGLWLCALAAVLAGAALTAAFPDGGLSLVRVPGARVSAEALAAAPAVDPAPGDGEAAGGDMTGASALAENGIATLPPASVEGRRGGAEKVRRRVDPLRAAGGAAFALWLAGVVLLSARLAVGW